LIASVWQGKRQGIFMLIFMIIARYCQQNKNINFKRIFLAIIIMVSFFAFFNGINRIRTNIGQREEPSYEFLLNMASPSLNMVSIVNYYSLQESNIFPYHVLSELLPNRYSVSALEEDIKESLFNRTSPSGYISLWYIDYKYFGVFLGSYLLGLVSFVFFSKRNESEYDMQLYILILWCCATSLAYTHFNSLNFFLLPFLAVSFLKKQAKYKIHDSH
jgi:hypothetical protein